MTVQNRARTPQGEFAPVGIAAHLLNQLNALLKRLGGVCDCLGGAKS